MKNKKKKILSLLIFGTIVLFSGCGCKQAAEPVYNVTLEIWGPLDNSDAYAEAISNYQALRPNTRINYKKVSGDTYKQDIVAAMAAGQGPDIFMISNNWLPYFKDKVAPAPAEIINEQTFRNNFADAVIFDFLDGGQVYAAPLSLDTLALYYNKSLFNEAGITAPPATWDEFIRDAQLLTRKNAANEITVAGAALGTTSNVNRATNVLGLLMMQYGTQMNTDNDRKQVGFILSVNKNGTSTYPAADALKFYTSFASASSTYYTWNPRLHYSVDAFSEGTLGMMLNYSWQMEAIRAKSPKLNFAVAPAPQVAGSPKLDYASYWGYAVSKNKATVPAAGSGAAPVTNNIRTNEAWKFLKYLTVNMQGQINSAFKSSKGRDIDAKYDPAQNFLKKMNRPAARLDLIKNQFTDPDLGVFAQQNLIARSWYQYNPEAIEATLTEAINQVNRGSSSPYDAIQMAAARINKN